MNNALQQKIAITKIPRVGPVLIRNLISYCGSVEAVYQQSARALSKVPGVGEVLAKQITEGAGLAAADRELNVIDRHQIKALFYLDPDYPQRLKPYHDAPIMLYYRGTADLNHQRIVAIVGTRTPTPKGIHHCETLVSDLQNYDALIVSGLAFGIDGAAHRRSTALGIPNVGVLGHGLSTIYPAQHRQLAIRMQACGGLLTEFSSEVAVEREHFPMRNRIIAGMCDALVVVETARKGGSMISAYKANDYGKDVFAIPGRLDDPFSVGCNHLIKTHGAALLESAEDIAYLLRWEKSSEQEQQARLFADLDEAEQKVVHLLQSTSSLSIDALSLHMSLQNSDIASLLLNLEFKGIVKTLPGKRYVLA